MSSVSELAQLLHDNLGGKKMEEIVLEIATKCDLKTRIAIAQYYKAAYGKSLFEEIKSKVGGDFGVCASQMFLSPLQFCLYHLKIGLKKQNECAFEMLTSKTPEELKIIEKAYIRDTGKDLKSDITKAFGGAVGKNLLNLFIIYRSSNSTPQNSVCEKYANKLLERDPKYWVEDEELFKEIFIQRSPEELILIARYYFKYCGKNIIEIVDKKIKGKAQILLKEILYNNIMPHELFAEKIHLAIKGAGTNEEVLSRVLVSRSEMDMPLMREIYQHKYNVSIKEDIIGDTSGAYQKLCIYLSEK